MILMDSFRGVRWHLPVLINGMHISLKHRWTHQNIRSLVELSHDRESNDSDFEVKARGEESEFFRSIVDFMEVWRKLIQTTVDSREYDSDLKLLKRERGREGEREGGRERERQNRTEQNGTEQTRPDQTRTDQTRPDQTRPEKRERERDKSSKRLQSPKRLRGACSFLQRGDGEDCIQHSAACSQKIWR